PATGEAWTATPSGVNRHTVNLGNGQTHIRDTTTPRFTFCVRDHQCGDVNAAPSPPMVELPGALTGACYDGWEDRDWVQWSNVEGRVLDATCETLTDRNAGLMWTRLLQGSVTHAEAVQVCADLVLGGFDDW